MQKKSNCRYGDRHGWTRFLSSLSRQKPIMNQKARIAKGYDNVIKIGIECLFLCLNMSIIFGCNNTTYFSIYKSSIKFSFINPINIINSSLKFFYSLCRMFYVLLNI